MFNNPSLTFQSWFTHVDSAAPLTEEFSWLHRHTNRKFLFLCVTLAWKGCDTRTNWKAVGLLKGSTEHVQKNCLLWSWCAWSLKTFSKSCVFLFISMVTESKHVHQVLLWEPCYIRGKHTGSKVEGRVKRHRMNSYFAPMSPAAQAWACLSLFWHYILHRTNNEKHMSCEFFLTSHGNQTFQWKRGREKQLTEEQTKSLKMLSKAVRGDGPLLLLWCLFASVKSVKTSPLNILNVWPRVQRSYRTVMFIGLMLHMGRRLFFRLVKNERSDEAVNALSLFLQTDDFEVNARLLTVRHLAFKLSWQQQQQQQYPRSQCCIACKEIKIKK